MNSDIKIEYVSKTDCTGKPRLYANLWLHDRESLEAAIATLTGLIEKMQPKEEA